MKRYNQGKYSSSLRTAVLTENVETRKFLTTRYVVFFILNQEWLRNIQRGIGSWKHSPWSIDYGPCDILTCSYLFIWWNETWKSLTSSPRHRADFKTNREELLSSKSRSTKTNPPPIIKKNRTKFSKHWTLSWDAWEFKRFAIINLLAIFYRSLTTVSTYCYSLISENT